MLIVTVMLLVKHDLVDFILIVVYWISSLAISILADMWDIAYHTKDKHTTAVVKNCTRKISDTIYIFSRLMLECKLYQLMHLVHKQANSR